MKRVLIIGSGGSGKSTLATELGRKLDLEVIHLDKVYWRANWQEPPKDAWLSTVDDLLERDSWVMDGNYSGSLARRIEKCDTIVFLDLPRLICLWRILKRRLRYRHGNRPDMAEGCVERFNLEFVLWVWNYSRRSRPKVLRLIGENRMSKQIFFLKSRKDVNDFLQTVK
jgi:adenylate kinase family enzyme